jgi:hypothetical protein
MRTPIYWVGPMPGKAYELTQSPGGSVFLRYLPRGVSAGSGTPYLTLGTYPMVNAFAVTQRAAHSSGVVSISVPGAAAFYKRSRPTNVYYARAGSEFQVEVFDPKPGEAQTLVRSGLVAPVAGVPLAGAVAPRIVSVAALRRLPSSVGHPVYWVGPKAGSAYELTQNADGKIYIRYMPLGARAGAPTPYLTVATYPFPGALRALKALGRGNGVKLIRIPGGGAALLDTRYPKSIHLAFPGSSYQVEVFDPSPADALQLVRGGAVRPIA